MHPLLVLDELVLRGCMKLKLSFATARLGHGVYYSTWHWRVYFVTSKHGHVLAFQISMARSLSKPQFSSSRAMLRWGLSPVVVEPFGDVEAPILLLLTQPSQLGF